MSSWTSIDRPGRWAARAVLALVLALCVRPAAAFDGETVIVTARKQAEPLAAIPGQVRAFDHDTLATVGVGDLDDYVKLDPALSRIRNGNDQETLLLIRGVGNYGQAEPSVGVFEDGAWQLSGAQATGLVFDLERIEVLHGPQGALYGKSSTGGAINLVRRRPTAEPQAGVSARAGGDGLFGTEGFVSGPLGDSDFAARAAWRYDEFDGFFTNTFDGRAIDADRHAAGRVMLAWQLRNDFDALLTLAVRDQAQRGFVLRRTNAPDNFTGLPFARDARNDFDTDVLGADLQLTYTAPRFTLTSITAVHDVAQDLSVDLDYSAQPIFFAERNDERAGLSEELRLASPAGQAWQWLLGGYWLDVDGDYAQSIHARDAHGPTLFAIESDTRAETRALFGSLEVPLGFDLYAGAALRYDHEWRRANQGGVRQVVRFDDGSAQVTLGWRPREAVQVYASFARMFKPGGINSGTGTVFAAETTQSGELGFKWANARLAVEGAYYRTHIDDAQNLDLDRLAFAEVTSNKGNVRIVGAELALRARLGDHAELGLAGTVNDADYDDYRPFRFGPRGPATYDLSGNGVQWVAEYAVAGTLHLHHAVTLAGLPAEAFMNLALDLTGPRPWDDFAVNESPRYAVLDLRTGFETRAHHARLSVFVDNLLDEGYYTNYVAGFTFPFAGGSDLGAPGRPRLVGVEFDWRY